MKILVLDNYDSFVYNLVHLLHEIEAGTIDIIKNDKIDLEQVVKYDKILLSPGPGVPKDAGLMPDLIDHYSNSKSILGVCLGHQAIAEKFGGILENIKQPLHGVTSKIQVYNDNSIFKDLPKEFMIGHYHSWVVQNPLPEQLELLAKDEHGQVMAIKHKELDVHGVQFHPESILTEYGKQIIQNWIKN